MHQSDSIALALVGCEKQGERRRAHADMLGDGVGSDHHGAGYPEG